MHVRFLPTRTEFVEVYTTYGEYIGRAPWTRLLDASEAAQAMADRRKAIRTMRTSLEDIAEADAAAKQAMKDAATAEEPSADDHTYGVTQSTAKGRTKRAQSAAAAKRKAAERDRRREDLAVMSTVVRARTGTDDLDF